MPTPALQAAENKGFLAKSVGENSGTFSGTLGAYRREKGVLASVAGLSPRIRKR